MITTEGLKDLKVGSKFIAGVHWRFKTPNGILRKCYKEIEVEIVSISSEKFKWAHFKGDKEAKLKAKTFYFDANLIEKSKNHFEDIYNDTYTLVKVKGKDFDGIKDLYIGTKGEYSEEE